MAFIETPNTALASILVYNNGFLAVNTLWFEGDSPFDFSALGDLGNALEDWWTTRIAPLVGGNVAIQGIRCVAQDAEDSPSRLWVANHSGTASGAALPTNTSATITFRTTLRGRSFRGRNYIYGLTESQVTDNVVSSTVINAYLAAYAALNTDVAAVPNSPVHVVVSHYHVGAPRASGLTTPVSGYDSSGRVKTQRRRLVGAFAL